MPGDRKPEMERLKALYEDVQRRSDYNNINNSLDITLENIREYVLLCLKSLILINGGDLIAAPTILKALGASAGVLAYVSMSLFVFALVLTCAACVTSYLSATKHRHSLFH